MGDILILNHSIPQIGYVARTSTQGEEFDMVNLYINMVIRNYSKLKSKNAAIFIEPQIDSGYPDIVIVEYNGEIIPNLNFARKSLSTTDLKILYHIHCKNNTSINDLSTELGYPVEEVKVSVRHLFDAKMVYLSKSGNHVRKKALSRYCAIKRIIAIEAKLDKWNNAIIQAEHNIWFATDTYILLNKERCSPEILDLCKEKGVGVILSNGNIQTVLRSAKREYPVSYASLQFNEWLCRYAKLQEESI